MACRCRPSVSEPPRAGSATRGGYRSTARRATSGSATSAAATWEEVDFRPAKRVATVADFGWSRWEGSSSYNPKITVTRKPLVGPLWSYEHTGAGECAIVGGYVYRGMRVPSARGKYFYGDYCTGHIDALTLTNGTPSVVDLGQALSPLTSFGQDAKGELYAVTSTGDLYELR